MKHCYQLSYVFKKLLTNKLFLFVLLFSLFAYNSFGQVTLTPTDNISSPWTVPADVYSITVECWGAGGGGYGDSQNNNLIGRGGGGGGYATATISVTPGQTIAFSVGIGGNGGNATLGGNGGDTTFSTLTGNGGIGGGATFGGTGGSASGGTTNLSGTNGNITGGISPNGYDGGDAGGAGGTGGTGGGDGINGSNGLVPGGGGGASGDRSGGSEVGGDGGDGQITITYTPCGTPTVTATTAITATTATINWTAATPAPANGYQYVVSTSNTTPAGAGTADAGSPANITGLTPGTTYYVFVRSNCGSGIFSPWSGPVSFNTVAGLLNDEPCGAIDITDSCISGTNVTATDTDISPVNNAGCGSFSGNEPDVWFTTVVGASGSVEIDALLGSMTDPVIAVYSGTCNGNLNLIACNDDAGAGLEAYLLLSGQTPGATLYIRVWRYNDDSGSSSGTFTICANNIADPCLSITNIASCGSTTINATIASGSGAFNNSCISTPGDEQIYSFTPSATGNYSITQLTTFAHVNYAYNTTCGSTGWTCIDDLAGNNQTSNFFNLTAGTLYYIMLDTENSTGGNVSFTLNCPPPVPPNDLCANVITLACGDADVPGTTNGATNVTHNTGCTMSNYGVWYMFIGDGNQTTIFTDAAFGFDHELSISSGVCGALTNIACIDVNGTGGTESYTFITTNGTRYFVYIGEDSSPGVSTDTGDFTISRSCLPVVPPPNDEACTATNLIVNASCVSTSSTNEFANNSTGVANPSCGNYQGGDVWFTVTVPPSFGATMTIDTQAGVVTNTGMAVYTGTCSGTLTEIACDDNSGTASMSQITLTNVSHGIVPGQVLYIRVWEYGNNVFGSFGICVTAPVPSNFNVTICPGDTSLPVATDLYCFDGGVVGGDISGSLSSSSPQAYSQQWVRVSTDPCLFSTTLWRRYDAQVFTVTSTATYVFAIDGTTTIGDPMGYIYETGTMVPGGPCSAGYVAGDDDSGPGLDSEITAFLTAGTSYTLVTTNALGGSTDTGSYNWDVGTVATSAEWYTASTGGTPVGYGSYFDPVAAGVIADTNTAGTWSFWASCPNSSDPRIETFYTINPSPSGVISGASSGACGSYDITITITDPSATQWDIEYSTDGGITTTPVYGISSPYTFTTTEPVGTVFTLEYILNYSGFCEALSSDMTGSATVISGGKTWNGSVSTDWNNAANWTASGVPTSTDCVVIPDVTNDPIISGATNADASSISVLNGGNLLIQAGGTITVIDAVTVVSGGTFELEGVGQDTAQLIQVNDVNNTGSITLFRETNVRSQDYVYWSSPVEDYAVTTIGGSFVFYWNPTLIGNPGEHGDWVATTENMVEGKGYAVRGPNGNGNDSSTATWQTIEFTGVPNNGNVSRTIIRGGFTGSNIPSGGGGAPITNEDDNWNLIGNPYPSAFDSRAFLTANTNIQGTVYLWTHGTRLTQGQGNPFYGSYNYNYNISDYLEYNLSGSSSQGGFDGLIGSCQGFYVLMLDTGSTTETVTFDNSMRSSANRNDQFFRTSNRPSDGSDLERHRIWLDLVTPAGNTSTALIAYAEGATNDRDRLYDASVIGGYGKNIYSRIEDNNFSIQGKALPFITTDLVPLGLVVDEIGEHAIAIQGIDGLFETTDQEIFIEDLALGIIHNIKEAPYFFNATETGEFNDRFVLRYTDNSLTIDEFNANSGISIIAPNSDYIKVTSSNNAISNITVYDMLGRVLVDKKEVNTLEYNINNFNTSDGTLFVKVTLVNGKQKIKKVVIRK